MFHIGSLIRQLDWENILFQIPWYASSGYHMYALYETPVFRGDGYNVFSKVIESCLIAIPVCFYNADTSYEKH